MNSIVMHGIASHIFDLFLEHDEMGGDGGSVGNGSGGGSQDGLGAGGKVRFRRGGGGGGKVRFRRGDGGGGKVRFRRGGGGGGKGIKPNGNLGSCTSNSPVCGFLRNFPRMSG